MADRLLDRRRVLVGLSATGAGSVVFGHALAALADQTTAVTVEMIRQAEWISGLEFTEEERELMLEEVNETLDGYDRLRQVAIDNAVPPALHFRPLAVPPASAASETLRAAQWSDDATTAKPSSDDDLAFAPVSQLSKLIKNRDISSVELTRLYLERLERFDPVLHCVITLTPELALRQAEQADREIAAGHYRGPLHGIPWGAKDLLAVPGFRTTWGAEPYRDQVRPDKATVVTHLEDAGAVLLAKLSLGALAWGDVWFDAKTRNPWNLEQGSSGSSAGPAAATAAALAGFTLGTETWGSIVSPCTRCGVAGLRPTFGRVSRHGAMALSWSMDKIGPIARSVEDCAVVFDAIHGADGLDGTAADGPFHWPARRDPNKLKIGFIPSLFDEDRTQEVEEEEQRQRLREWQQLDLQTLTTLRDMGLQLIPFELPGSLPIDDLALILTAEATTAFDELTRSGRDDLLVRQIKNAWPNSFRQGQLIPAVEYLRASRIRTLVMAAMEEALGDLDVYVCPSFGGSNLLLTNLTGHPCVVVPNGFTSAGAPASITFMGRLWRDEEALALAHAYQEATDFHRQRPSLVTTDSP